MLARAALSRIGRCALLITGASTLVLAGGCSTGSRFDFSSFSLGRSDPAPLADPTATASLPVPQESVYSSSGSSVAYRSPPPDGAYASGTRSGEPGGYQPAVYTPPQQTPRPTPRTTRRAGGMTVKVEQGDNLYSISRRYGVPVAEIQEANGLDDARLSVGQSLVIPGGRKPAPAALAAAEARPKTGTPRPDVHVVRTTTIDAPAAPATPAAVKTAAAASAAPPKQLAPPVAASNEITGPNGSGQNTQVARVDRLPQPEPMSGNSFRWPVQGRIISAFGTKPDGSHNDGIDVAVPMGTSVMAAENGVVAYAGDELKGYGNLVLVRHANNWVSAYANNDEILVKRGDQVRRGQVIAKAGRTGQASQPQLHFELRKGSRPVDPTKYMTSAQAKAD